MATFSNSGEAAAYFEKERFATENGMHLDELTEEYSLCSVELGEGHKNANGGILGGAMFTLADLAFASLSNNIHMPTVAQQVSINYLSAAKGAKLVARATYRKDGRNSCVVNVDVTDDAGRDIAQFVGTGFKLKSS